MKRPILIFIFQLVFNVRPNFGRTKHFLVEVEDHPTASKVHQGSSRTIERGSNTGGNDYGSEGLGLSSAEKCQGLKDLCGNRTTCIAAIKCGEEQAPLQVSQDGGVEGSSLEQAKDLENAGLEEDAGLMSDGNDQKGDEHEEFSPKHFEHNQEDEANKMMPFKKHKHRM